MRALTFCENHPLDALVDGICKECQINILQASAKELLESRDRWRELAEAKISPAIDRADSLQLELDQAKAENKRLLETICQMGKELGQ